MKISQAIQSYKDYHNINSKKNTVKNYEFVFTQFQDEFGERLVMPSLLMRSFPF